jgi:hypothetical protein
MFTELNMVVNQGVRDRYIYGSITMEESILQVMLVQ